MAPLSGEGRERGAWKGAAAVVLALSCAAAVLFIAAQSDQGPVELAFNPHPPASAPPQSVDQAWEDLAAHAPAAPSWLAAAEAKQQPPAQEGAAYAEHAADPNFPVESPSAARAQDAARAQALHKQQQQQPMAVQPHASAAAAAPKEEDYRNSNSEWQHLRKSMYKAVHVFHKFGDLALEKLIPHRAAPPPHALSAPVQTLRARAAPQQETPSELAKQEEKEAAWKAKEEGKVAAAEAKAKGLEAGLGKEEAEERRRVKALGKEVRALGAANKRLGRKEAGEAGEVKGLERARERRKEAVARLEGQQQEEAQEQRRTQARLKALQHQVARAEAGEAKAAAAAAAAEGKEAGEARELRALQRRRRAAQHAAHAAPAPAPAQRQQKREREEKAGAAAAEAKQKRAAWSWLGGGEEVLDDLRDDDAHLMLRGARAHAAARAHAHAPAKHHPAKHHPHPRRARRAERHGEEEREERGRGGASGAGGGIPEGGGMAFADAGLGCEACESGPGCHAGCRLVAARPEGVTLAQVAARRKAQALRLANFHPRLHMLATSADAEHANKDDKKDDKKEEKKEEKEEKEEEKEEEESKCEEEDGGCSKLEEEGVNVDGWGEEAAALEKDARADPGLNVEARREMSEREGRFARYDHSKDKGVYTPPAGWGAGARMFGKDQSPGAKKLRERKVHVDRWPTDIYSGVPLPIFDKSVWDHKKEQGFVMHDALKFNRESNAGMEKAGVLINKWPAEDFEGGREMPTMDGMPDHYVANKPLPEYRNTGQAPQEKPMYFLLRDHVNLGAAQPHVDAKRGVETQNEYNVEGHKEGEPGWRSIHDSLGCGPQGCF